MSYRDIGARLDRQASTILRIWRQSQEKGVTSRRSGSGAQLRSNARENRLLALLCWRLALAGPITTSRVLAQQWVDVLDRPLTASTVRRRLLREGFRTRRLLLRLPLTPMHHLSPVEWCQMRQNWDQE